MLYVRKVEWLGATLEQGAVLGTGKGEHDLPPLKTARGKRCGLATGVGVRNHEGVGKGGDEFVADLSVPDGGSAHIISERGEDEEPAISQSRPRRCAQP